VYPVAALRHRAYAELSSEKRHAFSHADEPASPFFVAWPSSGYAPAVIGNLKIEAVGAVSYRHSGTGSARVLQRIRQRLLHDPVRGQVHARGQLRRASFNRDFHRQARF